MLTLNGAVITRKKLVIVEECYFVYPGYKVRVKKVNYLKSLEKR